MLKLNDTIPAAIVVLLALWTPGCSSTQPNRGRASAAAHAPRPAAVVAWQPIGLSSQGRPIEAITLGSGVRRVLLIGGIHGDEPEGGRTINAVAAYLAALRSDATIRIIRDLNPDGSAAHTRTNARGVDLNRNWPARNFAPGGERGGAPLSEPETRTLAAELEGFRPDLVLVCHAARNGPFVNFDGPAGDLAQSFAGAAAQTDPRWRVVPAMGYPTPGSLGSLLGVDRGVPILTIEFARGHDPEAAWAAMRDGLGEVLHREASSK